MAGYPMQTMTAMAPRMDLRNLAKKRVLQPPQTTAPGSTFTPVPGTPGYVGTPGSVNPSAPDQAAAAARQGAPPASVLPRADQIVNYAQGQLDTIGGRQAPQAGRTMVGAVNTGQGARLDPRGQAQFRNAQLQTLDNLQGIATGQQAGAGELAVQRQGLRALAQQQGMARMARGGNSAMAARAAARTGGEIGLNVAGQAQQAALQDQASANAQIAGLATQGRGQDLDMASQNAQLGQQMNLANLSAQNQQIFQQAGLDQATSLANMQARLAQTGMNDTAQLAYLSQIFGVSQAEMQGRLAEEQIKMQKKANSQAFWGGLFQTAGSIGAGAALASDRELKKDARKVSRQIDDMLDKLSPNSYRYKNEATHGEGRRAGIYAQDLERSEAGKRIIREKPDGKYLDANAAISAALASVARLNARLRKVEGKGK